MAPLGVAATPRGEALAPTRPATFASASLDARLASGRLASSPGGALLKGIKGLVVPLRAPSAWTRATGAASAARGWAAPGGAAATTARRVARASVPPTRRQAASAASSLSSPLLALSLAGPLEPRPLHDVPRALPTPAGGGAPWGRPVARGDGRARRAAVSPARAYLCGARIPDDKRIEASLQYIYGIGHTTACEILDETGIENKRTRELTPEELTRLRLEVEKYEHGDELRRYVRGRIAFLKEIRCYRGIRHEAGLPVRGQRTRTNAKTAKRHRPASAKVVGRDEGDRNGKK